MSKLVLTRGVTVLYVPVDRLNRALESDNHISIDRKGSSKVSCTATEPKLIAKT